MKSATAEITSWVRSYTSELYQYTLLRVNCKETAEDIVQNTFLAAVESYSKFKGDCKPKTWLYSILKNKIADHLRQRYKEASPQPPFDPLEVCFDKNGRWVPCHRPDSWEGGQQPLLDNAAFLEVLRTCLEHLPAKWSSVMHLKFFYAQNSREICDSLKISLANFWQMIHRSKVMLRLCLEIHWFRSQGAN